MIKSSINPAIRSRCHLCEVKPLNHEEIVEACQRAAVSERGLNHQYEIVASSKQL